MHEQACNNGTNITTNQQLTGEKTMITTHSVKYYMDKADHFESIGESGLANDYLNHAIQAEIDNSKPVKALRPTLHQARRGAVHGDGSPAARQMPCGQSLIRP